MIKMTLIIILITLVSCSTTSSRLETHLYLELSQEIDISLDYNTPFKTGDDPEYQMEQLMEYFTELERTKFEFIDKIISNRDKLKGTEAEQLVNMIKDRTFQINQQLRRDIEQITFEL